MPCPLPASVPACPPPSIGQRRRRLAPWLLAIAAGQAAWGCGTAPPDAPDSPVRPVATTPTTPAASAPAACPPASPAAPPAAAQDAVPADEPAFVPLNPHRTELFVPPDTDRVVPTRQDESVQQVVLRGFANVGGWRALLAIDGQLHPVRPGDVVSGVEVIAVEPPRVVLQRGRTRWTAALYDRRQAEEPPRESALPGGQRVQGSTLSAVGGAIVRGARSVLAGSGSP